MRERERERLVVSRRNRRAEPFATHDLRELIAVAAHNRQPRPEAVEQARAEREARLEMLFVDGDRAVRREQPVRTLTVGDPVRVEEDDAVEQPSVGGDRARFLARAHPRGVVRCAHEDESRLGAPRGKQRERAHGTRGVEPVPDAAVPEHDLVVLAERGNAFAHRVAVACLWRLGRQAERHDVDDRAEARIAIVVAWVDHASAVHRSQPQISLLLARTDEVVAGLQRRVQTVDREIHHEAPLERGPVRVELDRLEGLGVIEVIDDARARAVQPARQHRPLRLAHDEVGGAHRISQRAWRMRLECTQRDRRRRHIPDADRGELDVRVCAEDVRELPVADAHPGHLRADGVGADEEHARPPRVPI